MTTTSPAGASAEGRGVVIDADPAFAERRPGWPLPAGSSAKWRWGGAVASYVAFALVVLAPLWSGSVDLKWDARDFSYPAFAYASHALRGGHLPLWNPFSNCGEPFISDPALVWYQPGAALAAVAWSSPLDGYLWLWTGTWAWAGLGAFVLAAVLGAGPAGAFLAAASFSFSGFFVGHGQHLPYLVTGAWFPWVLALGHLAVARRSRAFTLGAGVALGLSALGGYAGLVIFEVLALAAWLVLAFVVPWSGPAEELSIPLRRRLWRVLGVIATAVVLLVLVWSPALYAFLVEAREYTDRTRPVAEQLALAGNPFPPSAFLSFLFPRLVVARREFFPSDVSMTNAYLGAVALPFAALALAGRGRRNAWLLVFPAIWLWTAVGEQAGLRVLWHHAVPATRYMRHNGMLRVLALAPLAAAAGLGFTRFVRGSARRERAVAAAWLVVVSTAAAGVRFALGDPGFTSATVGTVLIAAALAVILWGARTPRRTAAGAAVIVAVACVDLALHVRSNSLTLWNPNPPASLRELERARFDVPPDGPRWTAPALQGTKLNLVQRIPVVEGYSGLVSSEFTRLARSRFSEVLGEHRYWLSPSAWSVVPVEAGIAALSQLGAGDGIPVFSDRTESRPPGEPVAPGTYGAVTVVSYLPERVEFHASVPGDGAILASTERFAPSWRVAVDGLERPIRVVNFLFRGVAVPPGEHVVVFTYDPAPFAPLLVLSHALIVLASGAAVLLWRRERGAAGGSQGRRSVNAPPEPFGQG